MKEDLSKILLDARRTWPPTASIRGIFLPFTPSIIMLVSFLNLTVSSRCIIPILLVPSFTKIFQAFKKFNKMIVFGNFLSTGIAEIKLAAMQRSLIQNVAYSKSVKM
jgi:hypothetical protein